MFWSQWPFRWSSGLVRYGPERLPSLTGNGVVLLNETVIEGTLEVNGSLVMRGGTAAGVVVNGHTSLSRTVVGESMLVRGALIAVETTFVGPLRIASNQTSLSNCTTGDITIEPGDQRAEVLQLAGRTLVTGDITFTSGKGIVVRSRGSEVRGKVRGGTVEIG
jgi:hypothetical protein